MSYQPTTNRPFRDSYERAQALGNTYAPQPQGYQTSTNFVGRPSQTAYTTGGQYPTTTGAAYNQTMGAPYANTTGGVIRTSHTEHTTRVLSPSNTYATGQTTYAGAIRPSQQFVSSPTIVRDQAISLPVLAGTAQSTYVGQSTMIGGSTVVGRTTTGRVSTRELDTKISTVIGEKVLVSKEQRKSYVKGYNYGESVQVGENQKEGGIINITESRLESVVRQSVIPQTRTTVNEVCLEEEEAVIVERYVDKPIEIVVQRKVPRERIVDVPYDVIVERPIEKNIYKEVITEKIMEKPREKIIEIPIEVVYEIPVEKIVERHIEFQTIVEVPFERIVERKIEEIFETVKFNDRFQEIDSRSLSNYPDFERLPTEVRTRITDKHIDRPIYIENIIERIVEVPVERYIEKVIEKVIEVPLERIIERPVYVDNIIEKIIDVPVKRTVEKPVEQIIEIPRYIDHIIEHPIAVERTVEKIVEIAVEKIVDIPVYVDNIVERIVETTREVEKPYEVKFDHPIEQKVDKLIGITQFNERPIEKVYEKPVKIINTITHPVEFVIEKEIYVPKENLKELQVPQISGKFIEKNIAKEVFNTRTTDRIVPVDKFTEVPVRKFIEVPKFVETIIEKEVPMERTIERLIERIVERRVEVPVEKIIEVPLNIYTDRATTEMHTQEEIINLDHNTLNTCQGSSQEMNMEFDDQSLEADIVKNQSEYQRIQAENASLMSELSALRSQSMTLSFCGYGKAEEECLQLKTRITELESRHSCVEQDTERLFKKSQASISITRMQVQVEDPQVEILRRELKGLISENCALVQEVRTFNVSAC